ncbi:MAG: PAC2 family protein [Promethearchaeota archaeon]|nr:MAG: PAC2 family protein [Candidatus Lokiarchaeota archaeon]
MYIHFEKKRELNPEKLHDPVVLIGFPGIALVGKLAITAIRDSIDAKLLMNIQYFDFPPKSTVEEGKLDIPTAKLYFKRRKSNDLLILTADYQPQTPEGVFEFSKEFCEMMDELTQGKIKMYISVGAMVSDKPIEDEIPMVFISGTDDKLMKSFLTFENTELMENGVIAGANGILPAWAGANGFAPGICLLAETVPMHMINLNPKASKRLVTVLKDYFNIDMTYDELDKKIEEMEEMLDQFKEKTNHFMRQSREPKGSGADSYFR